MTQNTHMPARAQVENTLQLVLDTLMHLGQPGFLQGDGAVQVDKSRGIYARDFGIDNWDWPQGVGLYGLEKLQSFYGDTRYDAFLQQWVDKNVQEGLPSCNINTTAPYLALLALKACCHMLKAVFLCLGQLVHKPRGARAAQRVVGGIVCALREGKQSVILNDSELWVDTLFMAVLFLAKAGVAYGQADWIAQAVQQILVHIKYLYEKRTGLFYHGWSFDRNDNFGGIFWCRGNSWFTYGILELLETLDGHIDAGLKAFFADTFRAQVDALCALQADSGLWHTILDDKASYEEVSGTAAFAAGMLKGVRLGLLDESCMPCAVRALHAVLQNVAPDGIVQNVSSGTAMGIDAEHYKNIAIAPISYGQSMTAFALIEALNFF